MTPLLSGVSNASSKRLLLASLLFWPGLAMAAALTPIAEGFAMETFMGGGSDSFAGLRSNRWCMLYLAKGTLQILDGLDCDRPQLGLVRQFD